MNIKKSSLLATIIVLFQVFVFFPISMWTQNQFNFDIYFLDGLNIISYVAFIAIIFSLLLVLLTPKAILNYLLPFLVLLSSLIFIQQNILVWDYGILDGNNLDFSTNHVRGFIDVGIWVIGGALFLFHRKFFTKNASLILAFSGIVSISVLLPTLLTYDFNMNKNSVSITEDEKFTYSKEKNILLFVLDGYQSDLFWEIIDNEQEVKSKLSGFKFYPNTSSVFAKTYPSIPLLLTGQVYQKKQSISDFIDLAFNQSLLSKLIGLGWDVGLYPYVKSTIPLNESVLNNYINKTTLIDKIGNYLQALDLSLFRLAPHIIKKDVFNNGNFILRNNLIQYIEDEKLFKSVDEKIIKLPKVHNHQGINFLENLKTHISSESSKSTFRFYHLIMPHSPFLLNRELEYGRYKNSFESYQNYAYASLILVIRYLEELKKTGIYDNSAIIILADHGGGDYTRNKYDSKNRTFSPVSKIGKVVASGKPLLLIKGFGDKGDLTLSYKAVSLIDIAPTVASFADIDIGKQSGIPINSIVDGQSRERKFYYYKFTGWDSMYLQDFSVFNINGNVYNENSWKNIGTLTANIEEGLEESEQYILNKIMRFGSDMKLDSDYSNKFLTGGNYNYLHSSVKSIDQQIQLSINLNKPLVNDQAYKIELDLSSEKTTSKVVIESNNKVLGTISLEKNKTTQSIYFQPNKFKNKNSLNLKIYIPNKNHDNEMLLSKIKIKKVEYPNLSKLDNNSVVLFSENIDGYYPDGFWSKKTWGRWTSKKESSIVFKTSDNFCEGSYLTLRILKFYKGINVNDFLVDINGNLLKLISVKEDKQGYLYKYDCSLLKIDDSSVAKLTFHTNTITSPSEVSDSKDKRKVGAGFVSLQFSELK